MVVVVVVAITAAAALLAIAYPAPKSQREKMVIKFNSYPEQYNNIMLQNMMLRAVMTATIGIKFFTYFT